MEIVEIIDVYHMCVFFQISSPFPIGLNKNHQLIKKVFYS